MPPIAALKRCATQELDPQDATQKYLTHNTPPKSA